jgi:hypothetical protein
MFPTNVVEEYQNTHYMLTNSFSKIVPFMRLCEEYSRAGEATDDNMAHTHFTLDT